MTEALNTVRNAASPRAVLVTGGSGFLGINLVRSLLAQGCAVTSLDVATFDYPDVADQVRVVTGDIRDRSAVMQAMAGVDAVVHTAAALPLYPPRDIYTTEVEGTRTVLNTALRRTIAPRDGRPSSSMASLTCLHRRVLGST